MFDSALELRFGEELIDDVVNVACPESESFSWLNSWRMVKAVLLEVAAALATPDILRELVN